MWTDPLLSTTPGTWAYDTMSRRLNKEILQRTYEENEEILNTKQFAKALEKFNELRLELDNASTTKMRYLKFDKSTDGRPASVVDREEREWKEILKPYIDNEDTWLSGKPALVLFCHVNSSVQYSLSLFDCSCASHMH